MPCGRPIIGGQETLCIRVPKVFDWVVRQVDVPVVSRSGLGVFPTDPCANLSGPLTVECIPVSRDGSRIIDPTSQDAIANGDIICQEIPQVGGRASFTFELDGTTVTLQKVKVLKKGFVRVRVTGTDFNGTPISTQTPPIEWQVAEKFFLCAPEGTDLVCHITDFECDATVICSNGASPGTSVFQQLDISINMCQEVQMEADIKIEVTGTICAPREDIPVACPPRTFPPQCPTVFPG